MSYSIYIYDIRLREEIEQGYEFDSFDIYKLDPNYIEQFIIEITANYGYVFESETETCLSFVKYVGRCPISVDIYDTEISFSIPNWDDFDEAIFVAFNDITKVCDYTKTSIYNPQDSEWITDLP